MLMTHSDLPPDTELRLLLQLLYQEGIKAGRCKRKSQEKLAHLDAALEIKSRVLQVVQILAG